MCQSDVMWENPRPAIAGFEDEKDKKMDFSLGSQERNAALLTL